ncbi:hypothetical protein Tco_0629501 [Tanacetum coccineum]|uniref:Uncharacterized protein n=1 Tax=Tanacetum coccineum TaxID=301880 RepID=A0ABQ4WTC2_9ASTR
MRIYQHRSPRADDHRVYLSTLHARQDPYAEAALQAPPSPDYVPGLEEPEQAPPSPDYVPGLEHDDDEIVAEDQPGEEDGRYGIRGLNEEDEDDEMDVEIDEEAEEEHLAPAYPVVVAFQYLPSDHVGYRAATIRMRAEAAATSHSLPLPPPFILSPTRPDAPPPLPTSAPTSFPPLSLPTDSHREGRPEQIRRDPERYVGYGITDSWDEIVETLQGAPVSTDTELGAHMREFESMVRRDTDEIYTRLDDEQGQRH